MAEDFRSVKIGSNANMQLGQDLNSSQGLLELARMRGGAVADVAEELTNPNTSLLSTVGEKFKNAFSNFVEIVSVPNQIVAGALSSKYTISEAIKNNIATSDVIWGEEDPEKDATTMKRVGGFLVRTATDILLDPLSYVTFGASQGVLGLRTGTKISLQEGAAAALGKETFEQVALSDKGNDLYKMLKNIEHQKNGTASLKNILYNEGKTDKATFFAKRELAELLEKTVDAPLNMDFAKKALSNMFEKSPQLAEELIDKGGIKFFGKTIASGQRIAAVTQLIPGMTALDKLTEPARKSVQALFDPSLVKVDRTWVRMPQEFIDLEDSAKSLIRSRADDRGRTLADIVRANKLTKDEASILTAAIEARKIPADPRLANAAKQFIGFTDDEFSFLREAGYNISYRDNHVPHILLKEEAEVIGPVGFSRTGISTKDPGATFQRKVGETIEEAKANGFNFDENIVTAHYQRSLDNTRAGVSKQFMVSVAESFGVPSSQAPKGFVKLDMKGIKETTAEMLKVVGKDGDEIVFHPAVAKRIQNFMKAAASDDATSGFLKAFDSIQNLWKAGVTAIFPSFHGRNAISNVFLNYMDLGVQALNPVLQIQATSIVADNIKFESLQRAALKAGPEGVKAADDMAELASKVMFTDASGYNWTFGEIRQTMRDRGLAFKGGVGPVDIQDQKNLANDLFPAETKAEKTKKAIKAAAPVTQDFIGFKAGRAVGDMIENQARVLNFVANLRNTGDVQLAANRTKQFLFDYQNLTDFEKNVLRRIVPFYTFTRKNLEQQVRSLVTTPGRITGQITAVTSIGDALSGGVNLTDEEKAALPDWIKTGINLPLSKDGSKLTVLGSIGTPIEQPFMAFQPNTFLGGISPLLRVPVEQLSGYSFYQGKFLSDVTNAAAFKSAPKALKDFIGFTEIKSTTADGKPFTQYVSMRPEMMNIVNNLPLGGRVLSAVKQMQNQDVSTQYRTLQQIVGLRPFSFDLEQEAAKRERELKTKLEKLLNEAKVTYTYKRQYVPENMKADLYTRSEPTEE